MDYSLLLNNISKYIVLTKTEQEYVLSLLEYKKISSKTLFLKEGEVCKYSTFVIEGCLRGYTIDKNGFDELIPAYYIKDKEDTYQLFPAMDRNRLAEQVPVVKKKYLLHL